MIYHDVYVINARIELLNIYLKNIESKIAEIKNRILNDLENNNCLKRILEEELKSLFMLREKLAYTMQRLLEERNGIEYLAGKTMITQTSISSELNELMN